MRFSALEAQATCQSRPRTRTRRADGFELLTRRCGARRRDPSPPRRQRRRSAPARGHPPACDQTCDPTHSVRNRPNQHMQRRGCVWTHDSGIALPLLSHTTQRESPAFPTKTFSPQTTAATAVQPECGSHSWWRCAACAAAAERAISDRSAPGGVDVTGASPSRGLLLVAKTARVCQLMMGLPAEKRRAGAAETRSIERRRV